MCPALFIALKDKPDDVELLMNGRALSKAWEAFDIIAEELSLPNFNKLCSSAWKSPEKGLPIFEAYLQYITQHPDSVKNHDAVTADLQDVVRLIREAAKFGTKWRLIVDY